MLKIKTIISLFIILLLCGCKSTTEMQQDTIRECEAKDGKVKIEYSSDGCCITKITCELR